MDENNKPVTSEEFNKQIREEKGLPEKEPKENKTNAVTVVMIIIFILSFVAGLVLIVAAIVTVVNKTNEVNTTTPKDDPKPVENKVVKLKEEDIKDYEDLMNYIIRIRGVKLSLNVKEITNQQLISYGLGHAKEKDNKYLKADVKEEIQKAFGDIDYKDENLLCSIDKEPFYEYDSEKEEYVYATKYNHGHGGEGGFDKYMFFHDAEKDETNGTLTIKYKIIYGIYQSDIMVPDIDLFLTAQDASEHKNQIYDMDDNNPVEDEAKRKEIVNKTYEEYKDKLTITTFIFEKDSKGNYGFKSVESK